MFRKSAEKFTANIFQLWPDGSKLQLVTVSWWDVGQNRVCRFRRWTLNEVNKVWGDRNNYFKTSLFNWERNLFFFILHNWCLCYFRQTESQYVKASGVQWAMFFVLSPKLFIKDFWTKTVLYIAQLQHTWKGLPIAITTSNDCWYVVTFMDVPLWWVFEDIFTLSPLCFSIPVSLLLSPFMVEGTQVC